jgi:hypothetical protein
VWRFSPALDAGFFIFQKLKDFRETSSAKAEAELEGEIAQSGPVSPARHVPVQLEHSDGIGIKVL